jgi:hypothetical protein
MLLASRYTFPISRLLSTLLVASVALVVQLSAQVVTASSGRDFWLAVPSLVASDIIRLNITAVQSCDVTVAFTATGDTLRRSLVTGERWEITIPKDQIMLDFTEYVSNKSIHLTGTAPVTANVTSDAWFVTESYCALPTLALGFDYLAMSFPSVAYPAGSTQHNNAGGFIAVIATQDGTEIRITPTVMTASGNGPGFTYGVSLRKGEIYQMIPKVPFLTDLTGTHITSNKPVGVYSGHRQVQVDSLDASNPLMEQMVPTVDWGKKFYSLPLHIGLPGYYSVLASRAGTEVRVNGLKVATLGAGASRLLKAEGTAIIEASAPVMVAQFTTTFPATRREADGDPSMMILNPVESYSESFLWGTPAFTPREKLVPSDTSETKLDTAFIPMQQYALITAPASSRGAVRLDGANVNFDISYNDAAYYSAIVPLNPGAHQVSAPAPVDVQLFGDGYDDAYSMPAGVRLREPFRAEPLIARTCRDFLDTTIAVSNVGTEQVSVDSIFFSANIVGTVLSPNFRPIDILPSTVQSIRVRIELPSYGKLTGTMTVRTTTSGARPLQIPIEIDRDSLAITAIEREIRFPGVTVSNPMRDTTIRLINTGTGPTIISGASFSGPFTIISPGLPVTLGVGDTLSLTIRFAPSGPGTFNGSGTITQSPCGAPVVVTLSGSRLRPADIAAAVPSDTLVCPDPSYHDIPLMIRNPGGEPLLIDSIEVSGVAIGDYSFPISPNGRIVLPGDSTVIPLRFAPKGLGDRSATLRIWNNVSPGGYYFLPISSRKDSVGLTPSLSMIDFGTLSGCEHDALRTITLRNSGTLPLRIDSIRVESDDFASTDGGGFTLEKGADRTIEVRFTPKGSGARNATLRIYNDLCDLLVEIPLAGEQQAAGLASPDTLDFGTVAICDLPLSRQLILTNSGAVVDTIRSLTLDGTGFTLGPLADSLLVPAGATSIPVTLQPQGEGDITGTVTVRAEPCGIERTIVLRGAIRNPSVASIPGIDFEELVPGSPIVMSTTLTNSGAIAIRLDSIVVTQSVPGLSVTSPPFPVTIEPGRSQPVEFTYSSTAPKSFSATATAFIDSPCVLRPAFTLQGREGEEITVTLTLPDTSAPVDSHLRIPIAIASRGHSDSAVTITGELRWNYSMLHLETIGSGVAGGTMTLLRDTIIGNEAVGAFSYQGPLPDDGVLATLDMFVLLGLSDSTTLDWTAATLASTSPGFRGSISTMDGSFRTLGICRIGGNRYVRLNGSFGVAKVTPNPASSTMTIEFRTAERGRTTLRLIDLMGREAARPVDGELSPGAHRMQIDLRDLSSGIYFYELRSPTQSARGEVVVSR